MMRVLFPYLEWICRPLRSDSRQDFLLGRVRSGDQGALITRLHDQGFETQIFAWVDDGQVASLRKREGSRFQYHVRIFFDGEVRGHFEYAPETDPIKHLRRIKREARMMHFTMFCGPYLQLAPHVVEHYDTISTVMQDRLSASYRA